MDSATHDPETELAAASRALEDSVAALTLLMNEVARSSYCQVSAGRAAVAQSRALLSRLQGREPISFL